MKGINYCSRIGRVAASVVFASAALMLVSVPKTAHAAMTVDQLVQKMTDAYDAIDSYKVIDYEYGYDTFVKAREESMRNSYKDLAKTQGVDAGKTEQAPQLKQGTYLLMFKRPYLLRMQIIKSDFVPDILTGSLLTYNNTASAKRWEAKLKAVPVALKRSVANDDSGGFLEMGFAFSLLRFINLKTNGSPKLLKNEKVLGKDCYVVEISFKPQNWTKFTPIKPDLKKWGIPQELSKLVDKLVQPPATPKERWSSIKYWIDSKSFLIVKTEEKLNGKFHWKKEFRNIEVDKLTAADFK